MQLPERSFEDQVVGASEEMEFSIESNNSVIFDILRDKMYKNKIGSICREVLSNCRDANREAGSDRNIEVTVIQPNQFVSVGHQSVSFRDYGSGITPERMYDVYLKYGASTKRGGNDQTGGFGLGAKTPFAYNDTFTVITTCTDLESGKNIKYYYTAMIDSSRKGKMVLLEKEETDEPTGTEVIVPIKNPEDRVKFEKESLKYTKFWGCVNYNNFKHYKVDSILDIDILEETDDYIIYETLNKSKYGLLIDGIPYPLEFGELDIHLSPSFSNHSVLFKFNTGELTLSASRETVQYDDQTAEKLFERCESYKEGMKSRVLEYISNIDSYIEACILYANIGSNPNFKNIGDDLELFIVTETSGSRFSSRLLDKYNIFSSEKLSEKFGYPLKREIEFKHHDVFVVKNYQKGYDKQKYIPLNSYALKSPVYYADCKKDVKRNKTIWEGGDGRFYLIKGKKTSTEREIADELFKVHVLYGLDFKVYSDVEKTELKDYEKEDYTYVKKDRVTVNLRTGNLTSGGFSVSYYVDRETGKVYSSFEPYEGEEEVNMDDKFFVVVDKLKDFQYDLTKEEINAIDLLSVDNNVYVVNKSTWERRLKGNKLALDYYEEVFENNKKDWINKAKTCIAVRAVESVSHKLKLNYDCISDILPNFVVTHYEEEIDYDYKKAYNLVRDEIKVDEQGLINKIEQNLSKYPLLNSYLEGCSGYWNRKLNLHEECRVQEYINQVNFYYESKN